MTSAPSQRTLGLLAAELRLHLPFAEMAEEDVRAFVAASRESYHAPGEQLYGPEDGVARRLSLIRRGTVRTERPGQGTPVLLEAGDLLPVAAVLAERAVTSTYVAVDDVFALEVDADAVQRIAARSTTFADFLHRRVERLLDASRQRLREAQAAELLAERSQQAPLSELPRRTPVTCAPTTPLREALQRMQAAHVGSIVAVDAQGAPVGILTRHDLLERVVLAERRLDTPLADVMTSPVAVLTLQDSVQSAMLEMARRGIRHVPVIDQGCMVGMVSERDLYALQRQSSRQIGRLIRDAADVPALAGAAAQIRAFARHLIGQGLSSPSLTTILSGLNDRLTARLVDITAAAHGLDLGQACWLAFGSEGRGEQTVATDQDNGLVLAEGADRARWLAFGGAVNEALAACGYPLCDGGVMAGQEACCMSVAGWLERFDRWIDRSEPEDLLAASIYFDLRPLAGRLDLAAPLRERIEQRAPHAALFLRLMATQALERRPPLNWRGALATTDDAQGRDVIDLKLQGTAIFVDAARLLALAHGLPALGTRERLQAAGPAAGVPERESAAWISAFDHLQLLRLRAQLAANDPKTANRVEIGSLGAIDRRVLREAFRVARELQQKIGFDLAHLHKL